MKKIIRKMKLTRFCSKAEYEKFMAGETLTNHTDHYRGGKGGSTSVGFCFTADPPKTAWRYLKGTVSSEVCMVMDIPKESLSISTGKYADYSKGELGAYSCLKKEFCLRTYSNKTVKLVKVLHPEEFATEAELEAIKMLKRLGLCQG